MSKTFTLAAAFVAGSMMVAANADVIGRAVSVDPDLFTAFNIDEDGDMQPAHDANTTDNGFDDGDSFPESFVELDGLGNPVLDEFGAPDYIPGDIFGIGRKPIDYFDHAVINASLGIRGGLGSTYYPFALQDDSLSFFPNDTQGIIRSGDDLATPNPIAPDTAPFFGVVDTVNSLSSEQKASWVFDISGATNLSLSIDFAAMGDFELTSGTPDVFRFDVSIDGGTPVTVFDAVADEAVDLTYDLLEDGVTQTTLNDPLVIGATTLNNTFQTLTEAIAGTGSELKLIFTAETDGGSEAFAFRNVILEGTVGSGTIAGDFNGDGTVDAADYTVYADFLGGDEATALAPGSGNNDGTVTLLDYDIWRSNFGNTAPLLLGGGGGAIPEPTTLVSTALALGLGLVLRKRIG